MDQKKIDQREINGHREPSIPLTSEELIVLMRCLLLVLMSEQVKGTDKEMVRRLVSRIDRYAERQGVLSEQDKAPANQ